MLTHITDLSAWAFLGFHLTLGKVQLQLMPLTIPGHNTPVFLIWLDMIGP